MISGGIHNGEKQILIVERLVAAYHANAQVLQSRELFHDVSSKSPNQLFGKDRTWEQYIGHPAGRSRGWVLLV